MVCMFWRSSLLRLLGAGGPGVWGVLRLCQLGALCLGLHKLMGACLGSNDKLQVFCRARARAPAHSVPGSPGAHLRACA